MLKLPTSPKLKVFLLLAVTPVLLTACTPSDIPVIGKLLPKPEEQPATITIWGLWEPKSVLQPVLDDYKKLHPKITIEYQIRSFSTLKEYKSLVSTRINEGGGADIVMLHNSWVPSLTSGLAPAPTTVFTTADYTKNFFQVASDFGTSGANIYAVPSSYDGLALVYNKDMFTAAQISSPPTSWDEFRVDAATKLTKRDDTGNIIQAGAAMGNANNIEHATDILGLLLAQAGVKVPEDLTGTAAQDVFKFYTNFVSQEKVWNNDFEQSVSAFAHGKVAMIFVPSWQLVSIVQNTPEANNLNIGVAPVPKAADFNGQPIQVEWGSFWMYAVPKNSKNSAAAWEFLKFASQPEEQRKIFNEEAKIRTFGEPPSNKQLVGDYSQNVYLSVYLNSASNAKSGILAGRAGNENEEAAVKTAVNSILAGVAVKDALTTLQTSLSVKP